MRVNTDSILYYMGESFTSHYMLIKNIQELLLEYPEKIDKKIIFTLEKILKQKTHDTQKLASILYRETATLLKEIALRTKDKDSKKLSLEILKKFSLNILNRSSLAASFALGTLPINLVGPDIENDIFIRKDILLIDMDNIFSHLKVYKKKKTLLGRSILWEIDNNRVLVCKFAKNRDDITNLLTEIKWILFLKDKGWDRYFEIPMPFTLKDHFLFSSKGFKNPFICFVVSRDYFVYPNGMGIRRDMPTYEFLEIISNNAKYLGMLLSKGIIHTAVIPLFHNRTQRTRRDDGGRYLWERGGRLDRWLESTLYPNIGKSGVRDFEHLVSYDGSNRRRLYTEIGNHILSFILMIGSYFRMKHPDLKGIGPDKLPIDVRWAFDREVMKKGVSNVIRNYFYGFSGYELRSLNFTDLDIFIERLIDEMGVDRHMEEILRVADQNEMSYTEFKDFLLSHGVKKGDVEKFKKGESDVSLITGPHLGEFNGRISIPELIEFVGSTSALIISSKYIKDNAYN